MAECAEKGLGVVKSKDFITEEQEELLWQKGFLGKKDPDTLHHTIYYLCRSRFGLHGGKEQRALSRWPECQITLEEINGKCTLVYKERVSKTNQGGIQSRHYVEPKVVHVFCAGYRPRCFIELFRKCQFYCPKPTCFWNAFYLQSDPDWKPGNDFWYLHFPAGKGPLGAYMAELMATAGIPGDYSNHS